MAINERDLPKRPVGYNFTTCVRISDCEGELVRSAAGWHLTPEGLTICPKQGASIKERSKQGNMWRSHTVGTEDNSLRCRGYPGKESPSWER